MQKPTSRPVSKISAVAITESSFRPYGQLIAPAVDGKAFDHHDAALNLQKGIPRFYIMRLESKGRTFHKITRHNSCTQCLGSLNGKDWLMVVCPPSVEDQPDLEQMKAFRISGDCFIKLDVGTWHAGPYFDHQTVDFYNLELSDTNIVDHFTHNFLSQQNIEFEIVD